MEGIQFVTNEKGERIAVLIDLKKYGELWEDIYDTLTARRRARGPRESLESVKKRLRKRVKVGPLIPCSGRKSSFSSFRR